MGCHEACGAVGIIVTLVVHVSIEEVHQVERTAVAGRAILMPQLTRRRRATDEHLGRIVGCPTVKLLLGLDDAREVVGTVSLVVQPLPTGIRARVEDLVVAESARGSGVRCALMLEAIDLAEAAGASDIDLPSNPKRIAARRLSTAVGFEQLEPAVFRKTLEAV
jgi:GNAT superfamily N-acetyltransferase